MSSVLRPLDESFDDLLPIDCSPQFWSTLTKKDLAQEWCNINQSDREEVFVAAGLILEYMRANGADVPHYLTAACAWVASAEDLAYWQRETSFWRHEDINTAAVCVLANLTSLRRGGLVVTPNGSHFCNRCQQRFPAADQSQSWLLYLLEANAHRDHQHKQKIQAAKLRGKAPGTFSAPVSTNTPVHVLSACRAAKHPLQLAKTPAAALQASKSAAGKAAKAATGCSAESIPGQPCTAQVMQCPICSNNPSLQEPNSKARKWCSWAQAFKPVSVFLKSFLPQSGPKTGMTEAQRWLQEVQA